MRNTKNLSDPIPLNHRRQFRYGMLMLSALLLAASLAPVYADVSGDKPINFNQDIRPILSENCYFCHGPDEQNRKADLRLDLKSGAFSAPSGYPVIVPGKPDESELYRRITSDDDEYRMPPAKTGKTLTPEQIDLLTRWIKAGADWQEHWSFVTPTRLATPKVKNGNWVKNPIDAFILARLESEGLQPSKAADKRTLIRRVSFDLTGLPPTLQEVREFVSDNSPDAYEKMIDRFLAKPQYGEHQARFWLDVARYGDTHGLHLDNYREIWPYRDWVIQAFNNNMPFDQFTTEQLAGDMLPEPTLQQRIATGFNRCNVSTSEGGSIDEEYYVRYAVDRTSTTSTVWMGLTVGCAVCHDHKYDPVTQKEFYQLSAFFNNITEKAMDGNRKNPPPVVKLPTPEQEQQLAEYDTQISALDAKVKAPILAVDAAQAAWEAMLPQWTILDPKEFSSQGGAKLEKLDDKSILASGDNPEKEIYEVTAELPEGEYTAIRLEGLKHKSLPKEGAGRSDNSNVVLTEFEVEIASTEKPDEWKPIRLIHAWADYEQPGDFAIANAIDGKPETGWATEGNGRREDRQSLFLAAEPFGAKGGKLKIRLKHESENKKHQFGRFRFAVTQTKGLPQLGSRVSPAEWYSVGPFPAYDANIAFYQAYEPEGKPFNRGQEFTVGDKKLKWERRDGWTDSKFHYDLTGEQSATYLYRNIRSDTKQRVTLFLGSDDAIKAWVNGTQILAKNIERGATPHQTQVQVELQPGNNTLMLKVVNDADEYGFFFAVESDPELAPTNVVDIAPIQREKRTDEQTVTVRDYFRNSVSTDPGLKKLQKELVDVRKKRTDLDNSLTTTLVMEEREDRRETYILSRGRYDHRLDPVSPVTPAVLPPMPKDAPLDRLGFAKWLLDPSHPLTSRVTVNRFWQQMFGVGIVKTAEDFGAQGERPSHPELLDWLATEFINSGWDMKSLMKLMLTSATYRQTAQVTPEVLERDLKNRLYARAPRFRLDAEMLRDQALAISGLLRPTIGGPSVKPPQPDGLWYAVGYSGSNTVRFKKDEGADKVYRRTLYTFIKRTAPPPQMAMLDAPSREACSMRRERTNTPLQALMLMNDPQYVEAARAFAERIIKEGGTTPEARIAFAFETATARPPDSAEAQLLLKTLQANLAEFRANPEGAKQFITVGETPPDEKLDPAELAAWTMLTNLLLNLDEVISKG
jgi:hypothetical protein